MVNFMHGNACGELTVQMLIFKAVGKIKVNNAE